MTPDDELSSVRVEVEGFVAPRAESPDFETVDSAGPPRWLAALALAVLAAVGAALVVLQPDSPEVAEQPNPPESAAARDEANDDEQANLDDELPNRRDGRRATLTPINLDLDWEVDSIVATDTGFFGLEQSEEPTPTPPIRLSGNGRDWLRVNATVSSPSSAGERRFVWSGLARTTTGFAVTARRVDVPEVALFVSADGGGWRQVAGFGSVDGAPTTPVFVDAESVIGLTPVGNGVLNDVIATHTDLGGGTAPNVCSAFDETDSLLFVTCGGGLVRLRAENVVSGLPVDDVLQCVQRLARVRYGATPGEVSFFDRITGEVTPALGLIGAFSTATSRPSGDPLALLDFGVIDTEARTGPSDPELVDGVCGGIAELPTLGEPAVVVVDPELWTEGFQRVPFPDDGISTNPANVSVVGVLEPGGATTISEPHQHVVVQRPGGAVWLVDMETEAWTLLGGENRLGRELVAIDDAGTRIYQMNADSMTAFDIAVDAEISVEVEATTAPLVGAFRGLDRIVFADSNMVFFTDATDLWLVDTTSLRAGSVDGGIVANRIAPGEESIRIVATERGLIGLAQNSPGRLRLLRSINGVDWSEVDTTVTFFAGQSSADYFWFGLQPTSSGFAMWGSLENATTRGGESVDLFVSDDGANWEQVDVFGSLGDGPIIIPAAVDDSWIVGREFVGDPELTQIIVDHTNIEIPDGGICAIDRVELELLAVGCNGGPIAVTAENVTSDVLPAQVLNCLGSLPFTRSFSTSTVTVFDRDQAVAQRLDEPIAGGGFIGALLSNGAVALRDEGLFTTVSEEDVSSVEQTCFGIVQLREERLPGVVILDPETLEVTRVAFPESEQSFAKAMLSELVGVVTSPIDGSDHLVFTISDALWALNVEAEEWTLLAAAGPSIEDDGRAAFALSDAEPRVYRVAGEITVFDLVFSDAGVESAHVTTVPIEQSEGPGTRFDAGTILYADTDSVLYLDPFALGGALWSFPIPAIAPGG